MLLFKNCPLFELEVQGCDNSQIMDLVDEVHNYYHHKRTTMLTLPANHRYKLHPALQMYSPQSRLEAARLFS